MSQGPINLDQLSAEEQRALLEKLLRRNVSTFPLASGQQALYAIEPMAREHGAYNFLFAGRVRGPVDVDALRKTLSMMVERHPALRTAFVLEDEGPRQKVATRAEVDFSVQDARGLDDGALLAKVHGEARAPFELARGSLFRARLFTRAPDDHALLLAFHHIVVDAWSVTLFFEDLFALYPALRDGRPLPELRTAGDYGRFVRWQNELLASPEGERLGAYWKRKLQGANTVLELPLDFPRPPLQTYRGAIATLRLDRELTERLKGVARGAGATLYVVLLAAFEALLHRSTGHQDFLVGTPTAGRHGREFEGTVGYFVNPVLLRARINPEQSFQELLGAVRADVLETFQHDAYPFARLVQELEIKRDPSRPPLMQVMFGLQKAFVLPELTPFFTPGAPAHPVSRGGLVLEPLPLTQQEGQLDLTLDMAEIDGELFGCFKYNADLFSAATMGRMAERFRTVLESVVNDPGRAVGELSVIPAAERAELVSRPERSEPYPDVMEAIAASVARQPDAPALTWQGQTLSYRELLERAVAIARELELRGVGAESRVGLYLERTPDLVASVLGTLLAGAAYVPLDPSLPAERLAYMAEDAQVQVVVSARDARLPFQTEASRLFVEDVPPVSGDVVPRPGDAERLAYVLYTSGSTGRPKGVAIPRRALSSFVGALLQRIPLRVEDTLLAITTLSFDISVVELIVPLVAGARIVLATREQTRSGEQLVALARAEKVTHLQATPTTWRMLIEAGWKGEPSLVALSGGEALPAQLAEALCQRAREVWNLYGPTETTVWSMVARIERGMPVSLGSALPNTYVMLLDARGQLVPRGTLGEVCIGGQGVARGYVGRPELTAERFILDPLVPGSRMYRTGDLARIRHDGTFEYAGRMDDQAKIRGHRIEPGEVEAVVVKHPDVVHGAVVVRAGPDGEKRLVAYVVARSGSALGMTDLRAFLAKALPEYMVPAAFVFLSALPVTPSGKVDRKALPDPTPVALDTYVEPRTGLESTLCDVFREVLGANRVGIDDNFFELGGDSISRLRVVARAAERGVRLTAKQVFLHQTVRELAASVSGAGTGTSAGEEVRHTEPFALCPLPREQAEALRASLAGNVEDILPATAMQQGMLFHVLAGPRSDMYVQQVACDLVGTWDEARLADAWRTVVRHHGALRTCFRWEGLDQPVQVVLRDAEPEVAVRDFQGLVPEERERALEAWLAEERARGLEPSRAPMMRVALLRSAADRVRLVWTFHHTVLDGWSLPLVVKDVLSAYDAALAGRPAQLTLARPFRDHVASLAARPQEERTAFWRRTLEGWGGPVAFPVSKPSEVQGPGYGRRDFTLAPALTARLQEVARSCRVTPANVVQAAWSVVLARRGLSKDVLFGVTVSGRSGGFAGSESMVGLFINTLPLRIRMKEGATLANLLTQVSEQHLELEQHAGTPLVDVQAAAPVRGQAALFETIVVFENYPLEGALDRSGSAQRIENVRAVERNNFPLTVVVMPGESMHFSMAFDTARMSGQDAEQLFQGLNAVLTSFAQDVHAPLGSVSLLPPEERHKLLVEWNDTALDYPAVCMHELVQAQVRRTPEAVAVISGTRTLTYAELNRRANQLAHHLRRLGVESETRVGLCVERTEDIVIGLLGILKAGGVYVPLDPAYPQERQALILEDAQVPVLITQQRLAPELPDCTARRLFLDADWPAIGAESTEDPVHTTTPEKVAYLIYTSGSTGRPKGVMIEHRNAVAFLAWATRIWAPKDLAGTLASTSICFDISVFEIFAPLSVGGRVIVARNALELPELPAVREVTLLNTVPSAMAALLRAGAAIPPSVGIVNLAGEPLSGALVDQVYALGHVREVYNLYGPSETTTYSTYSLVRRGETPNIGRPVGNTQVYVVDQDLQPVPVGVMGEVYIGGAGVARGYLGRPELTAERFLRSPFGPGPDARMYKVGDLARWLPTGELEYLGRMDHQVKLRGFRIELGEIGAVLMQHPGVREAVVVVREDAGTEKQLVAYVVARGEQAPEPSELRSYLKSKLPEFMVPSAFVSLEAMPLLPNGKLDRGALPAPRSGRVRLAREHVEPRTPTEESLAAIWRQALGVEQVGIHDNFFEIGGHSLLLYRVLGLARSAYAVEIPLRALLKAPTLADMARAIEAVREGTLQADDTAARMEADAVLEAEIDPRKVPAASPGAPRTLLLTGATGFLGAFLLEELCRKTEARIYCLVRCESEQDGLRRIRKNLEGYSLWSEALASRIVPIRGDISQPLLGLSEAEFQRLSEEVDAIYHNGALVNFLFLYDSMRAANVLGTKEILRLATRTRAKPLHYVSTISVLPLGRQEPILEDAPLDTPTSVAGGYSQTKWVAEKLVKEASLRGLPVTIYRPGRVTGHSRTGAWNTDDLVCRTLKGCIRLGAAPHLEPLIDLTPVDYVSGAIVDLSMRPEALGKTYHIVNPHLIGADVMWGHMNAFGYGLRTLRYDEWLARLSSTAGSDRELSELLLILQQIPLEDRGVGGPRMVVCDSRQAVEALRGTETACPPVDLGLVSTYLGSLVSRGFLEAPAPRS